MKPNITIITPTYNQGPFIADCIESVLAQTYPNWEMIIIDDHSTDDTSKIVPQYMKDEKRVRYIRHTRNWGVSKLRDTYNEALQKAQGEYVAILEGDDMWPKDKLETQLKAFDSQKVVLAYGDWVIIDKTNRGFYIGSYNKPIHQLNNIPRESIFKLFAQLDFSIIPVTVMIRKSALDEIGGFQSMSEYPFIDIPTIFTLARIGEFKYQQYILGYYRKHAGSTWYDYAKKTKTNFRNEIQYVLHRHMGGVSREVQKNIMPGNSDRRLESDFLHSIIFAKKSDIRVLAKKILDQKQGNIKIQLLAFISIIFPQLADSSLRMKFMVDHFIYSFFKQRHHE
ncbi:glycosyltransferase family 2 protein [Candidatus Roizmanbacteria bacterium]|nr:MAG: glycosyltransferase family 2 protein [Candidatus Roizmanbacteria bacterium]